MGEPPTASFPTPVVRSVKLQEMVNIEGSVNERRCRIIIDTGSFVNLLSVDKFGPREALHAAGVGDMRVFSVSGENLKIYARKRFPLKIGNFITDEEFLLIDMEEECILGSNFLQKHAGKIDFASGTLSIKGEKLLLQGKLQEEEIVPAHLQDLYSRCSESLTEEEKKKFRRLLGEFKDVFAEDSEQVGECKVVQHRIDTGDHVPIKQAPRRLPFCRRAEVDQLIAKMQKQGVIEESKSPWSSPIVLVKKKDGSTRFCVDYRRLNAVTKKDSYPLPRIEDTLDALSGSSWFSTIDLQSGYWQIAVDRRDREKTAFCTGSGLWQFKVMPFGLCNAPATFERLMESVLADLTWKICLVYLDDVIVFGQTFQEEVQRLKKVFTRLREVKLLMNPKKCSFFCKEVTYLGHVVSSQGVDTDPKKISAVRDWPMPKNKTELRSFLGLCTYYRKFVQGFSRIARPLHRLTEDKMEFVWTEECQEAFEALKRKLEETPVLAYPRMDTDFILDTDASNFAIGSVLSQVQDGVERVVAYFSKTLGKAERNYCVTRKELLAIVKSVEHFHHYLYGRKFLIRTDHAALTWLLNFKNPEGQTARWIERLQEYQFEIQHRAGRIHGNADSLSRRPCGEQCKRCSRIDEKEGKNEHCLLRTTYKDDQLKEWITAQEEDEEIKQILLKKKEGVKPSWQEISSFSPETKYWWAIWDSLEIKEGLLCRRWESTNGKHVSWLLVVPKSKIEEVLKECHDAPLGGHFGIKKTLAKVRERFYWLDHRKAVDEWCRRCYICSAKKGPAEKGRGAMKVYNVGAPFERIALDIVGPLPRSSAGNKYALVVVDYFSKWPEVIPIPNQQATTIAKVLLQQVISRYGVPLELHSDQGRSFESSIFKELLKMLGIKKTRTTPLHPQSDGLVERMIRTLLQYLSQFVSDHQKDWDEWIPTFLLAYRTSRHETTAMSPAMVFLGRELRLPLDLLRGSPPTTLADERTYVEEQQRRLNETHDFVRQRLRICSDRMKSWYDSRARPISFAQGEKVWLYNPRRTKGKCPKLQFDWEGPYEVVERLNDLVYRIVRSPRKKPRIVHVNRLARFKSRMPVVKKSENDDRHSSPKKRICRR